LFAFWGEGIISVLLSGKQRNVLRIGIKSFGSPAWGAHSSTTTKVVSFHSVYMKKRRGNKKEQNNNQKKSFCFSLSLSFAEFLSFDVFARVERTLTSNISCLHDHHTNSFL
jgi:hypothetical protein